MEGTAMNIEILKQWERVAVNVCRLDDTREAGIKHNGLSNLLNAVHNELGRVLDACLDEAVESDIGKISFSTYWRYIAGWNDGYNETAKKCVYLLTYYFPEVKQWEADDDEMEGKRRDKLEQYKYTYVDTLEVKGYELQKNGRRMEIREPHPDSIYCTDGLYRKFWELRLTSEYQILRKLQAVNKGKDDLETLYKSVCLYVSLSNEMADVKENAEIMGINLQTMPQNASNLPQNELYPQSGIIVPPDKNKAPAVKWQNFLRYVELKNHKKAERLLQRVKEKYCTANYEWIASRWKRGKSRLALTCFSYLASQYLEIKPYEYAHNKSNVESETRNATNWQAFEMLFEYDGKKADKSGRYYQLADVWKQRCKYDEQERFYQCPEMIEIKKLFNNK